MYGENYQSCDRSILKDMTFTFFESKKQIFHLFRRQKALINYMCRIFYVNITVYLACSESRFGYYEALNSD